MTDIIETKKINTKVKVSASEVGRVSFCPQALFLQKNNPKSEKLSMQNQKVLMGIKAHNLYNKNHGTIDFVGLLQRVVFVIICAIIGYFFFKYA